MKKRLSPRYRSGQRGFTLIEVLVVVAIIGILAAVAVPMVSMFIGEGKTEGQNTELHNIQTAVTALLVKTADGQLNDPGTGFPQVANDMSAVEATVITDPSVPTTEVRSIAYYMTGLNADGTTKTGCTYTFQQDGRITLQVCPP